MTLYSMRAECWADTNAFLVAMKQQGFQCVEVRLESMRIFKNVPVPDVKVQFVAPATIEQVQQVLATIPDSHVMAETLRPCSLDNNSLERRQP